MENKKAMQKDVNEEKAKRIVTLIPLLLILLIFLVTLMVRGCQQNAEPESNLQDTIKEYADIEEISSMPNQDEDSLEAQALSPSPSKEPLPSLSPSPSPTPTPSKPKKDYSKIAFDQESQLKEMMTYWADNHQSALDDLAALDWYRAMSYKLKGTTDFYYYGDQNQNGKPNGTGIAVYADNQYYYGQWENGLRSGKGTWIHYHFLDEDRDSLYTYHQYTGSFKNDLPDGEGSEHYDYQTEVFEPGVRYITNLIGSYSEGLISGSFYLTTTDQNDTYEEWEGTASHGSWEYQNENRDKKGNRTVQIDINDPNNYMWMSPSNNKGIRVPCLISEKW